MARLGGGIAGAQVQLARQVVHPEHGAAAQSQSRPWCRPETPAPPAGPQRAAGSGAGRGRASPRWARALAAGAPGATPHQVAAAQTRARPHQTALRLCLRQGRAPGWPTAGRPRQCRENISGPSAARPRQWRGRHGHRRGPAPSAWPRQCRTPGARQRTRPWAGQSCSQAKLSATADPAQHQHAHAPSRSASGAAASAPIR